MKAVRNVLLLILALCVGAALMFGYQHAWRVDLFTKKTGDDFRSGPAAEILVMHTNGGLLEVSRILATEQFDKTFIYSMPWLNIELGRTVAHIRVPAVYRYHIKLASDWKIIHTDEVFTVITPPVQPTRPVAVDLAKMEKDVGGNWVLVAFNSTADLNALEREITATLAKKADSSAYLGMQREEARKAVTEFVEKWLGTQQPWRDAQRSRLDVVFGE